MSTNTNIIKSFFNRPLATPTDLPPQSAKSIGLMMNAILADVFALYLKTKNFHWHVSGPHFRDYHLLFDQQASELLAMTDEIAERIRKIGQPTLRSIEHIANLQRILNNNAVYVEPSDMLAELREDNQTLTFNLREAHNVTSQFRDIATSSFIENWVDQAERRAWFLFEAARMPDSSNH
ncbi:Dps family protein [Neisseria sp. Ec49-e6-T10]|uniref:Dps family protein n=1 Tax=Neisseria sp. Ec49-e6-T10 TaxID=3140744 RepID=UPI003EB7A46E